MREFNLRERAEIVSIAQECSKSLAAQPLIDYFNNVYVTKFQNGNTLGNTIINKYFPDSNEVFRRTVTDMMIDYTFAFEHVCGDDKRIEITKDQMEDSLKKFIVEEKEYLFYEQGMYPNFVTKDVLIARIINDLFQPKTEGKSCSCGMEGDNSGLDKDPCSCAVGGSCEKPRYEDPSLKEKINDQHI